MYIRIVNLKFSSKIDSDAMQALAKHEMINNLPGIMSIETIQVNDLHSIVKSNQSPKKVMFILGMESGSPTVGGKGTSADGFIKMTGGINVMNSFEGWKPVSTESIIEASPDFIIISNRGLSSFKTVEKLGQHPTLIFTPASKRNNIVALDGMAMLGFGPRTISSAKEVALRYISKDE